MADRRLVRRLAAAAGLAALLAGCAAVPTSGRVQRVARPPLVGALPGQGIRVLAPAPPRGGTAPAFVTDFLLATGDPQGDFATARRYLSPRLARSWDPRREAVIFDGTPTVTIARTRSGSPARTVRLTVGVTESARLSRDGDYSPGSGTEVSFSVDAQFVRGRWQLTRVPPGIAISSSSFALSFHALDLYFFDPGRNQLVPDRVFLPGPRAELAATVVRALLRGPSERLAGAVVDALPGTARLGSVATGPGNALDVALRGLPPTLSANDRTEIDAQLVWTLNQLVPEGRLVRVTADGAPLLPGSPVNSVGDYTSDGPNAVPAGYTGYFVAKVHGQLLLAQVDGQQLTWGGIAHGRAVPLRHPAVALAGGLMAGLSCPTPGTCRRVYVGPVVAGGPNRLAKVLTTRTGTFDTPSWGRQQDAFWVVRNGAGAPRAFLVTRGGPVGSVRLGLPPGVRSVPVLRVSRDGTRVAMVVVGRGGTQVLVGSVTGRRDVRVGALVAVAGAMQSVSDVSWAAADELLLIGQLSGPSAAGAEPYTVPVDGSAAPAPVVGTGLTVAPTAAASGPQVAHSALLAGGGRIYLLDQPTWQNLGVGEDPAYPG